MTASVQNLGFYNTPPHECSYFPDRQAITLFADPRFPKSKDLYSTLANYGFRRSGKHLYQPHCKACTACIPVRIPVNEFNSRRNQRRLWKKNKYLTIKTLAADFYDEHFQLYKHYQSVRHAGGGMDNPTTKSYMDFLIADWMDTVFYEMRLNNKLLAVAVVDQLKDGLSAVYTFFDPEYSVRSLGTYAILLEIEDARRLNLGWVYLGYWINGCAKMSYKSEFQPLEYFINNSWKRLPKYSSNQLK